MTWIQRDVGEFPDYWFEEFLLLKRILSRTIQRYLRFGKLLHSLSTSLMSPNIKDFRNCILKIKWVRRKVEDSAKGRYDKKSGRIQQGKVQRRIGVKEPIKMNIHLLGSVLPNEDRHCITQDAVTEENGRAGGVLKNTLTVKLFRRDPNWENDKLYTLQSLFECVRWYMGRRLASQGLITERLSDDNDNTARASVGTTRWASRERARPKAPKNGTLICVNWPRGYFL